MKLNFTENDIYEAEFATKFRGYDKDEVDEFLDKVMEDYVEMQETIERLQSERSSVERLATPNTFFTPPVVEEVVEEQLEPTLAVSAPVVEEVEDEIPSLSSLFNFEPEEEADDVNDLLALAERENRDLENTNYDLIKRLAQLEKEVASLKNR